MKQVPGINYLCRRGAVYVFYRRVPKDLVGKPDITRPDKKPLGRFFKQSLDTPVLEEAKPRVRAEADAFDRRMDYLRKAHHIKPVDKVSQDQVNAIGAEWRREVLWSVGRDPFSIRDEADRDARPSTRDIFADSLSEAGNEGFRAVAPEVTQLLADRGLSLSWKSDEFRRLCDALISAKREALTLVDRVLAHESLDFDRIIEAPTAKGPMFSEVSSRWLTEKAARRWVPKTEHEHRVWTKHFQTVCGNRPIPAYAKADGRAFRDVLVSLPKNWTKHPALRDRGVAEAAEEARRLKLPPMSDKNINKLLGYVSSFWLWARKQYDEVTVNPFEGLKLETRHDARAERDPFTTAELQAIFNAPRFTGCEGPNRLNAPGTYVPRDKGVYWVPLIALLTGARLGEIVQFRTRDVQQIGDYWVFKIHADEDDMRLKTPQSARFTPVHPLLVELGLLQFVEQQGKAGRDRLFPELKKGEDGYYSSPFSKSFARWLRILEIKRNKNAFHSFRHNFEDACRAADISARSSDALLGHKESGSKARYGGSSPTPQKLQPLVEAMARIRHEGLPLVHLKHRPHGKPLGEGANEGGARRGD
ncbi:MAG: site-specific integrase [Magnetospirillum sp.]|nr:site-specific integrase [Magnetospirillum sp.]